MKSEQLKNQSISHGTLRNQDLILSFLEILNELDSDRAYNLRITHEFPSEVPEDDDAYWDSEEAAYLLNNLVEDLELLAPIGYYFGAHPGNGSDFGFWILGM